MQWNLLRFWICRVLYRLIKLIVDSILDFEYRNRSNIRFESMKSNRKLDDFLTIRVESNRIVKKSILTSISSRSEIRQLSRFTSWEQFISSFNIIKTLTTFIVETCHCAYSLIVSIFFDRVHYFVALLFCVNFSIARNLLQYVHFF